MGMELEEAEAAVGEASASLRGAQVAIGNDGTLLGLACGKAACRMAAGEEGEEGDDLADDHRWSDPRE